MNSSNYQWKVSLTHPWLTKNAIHIWQASLDVELPVLSTFEHMLTEEEVTKAKRLYFEKDRHHFITARGILRTLLGRYLNTEPHMLRFDYNTYGKPSLGYPFAENILYFNMSHSNGIALYAFTYANPVGIDVEYVRPDIDYEQLARHSFSLNEQIALNALPKALRLQAFFNGWTRKEAYIKARGRGLSLPLDLFDVSLQPGKHAALLSSREGFQETIRWSIQEILPGFGYAGAFAIEEGREYHVSYWQWPINAHLG